MIVAVIAHPVSSVQSPQVTSRCRPRKPAPCRDARSPSQARQGRRQGFRSDPRRAPAGRCSAAHFRWPRRHGSPKSRHPASAPPDPRCRHNPDPPRRWGAAAPRTRPANARAVAAAAGPTPGPDAGPTKAARDFGTSADHWPLPPRYRRGQAPVGFAAARPSGPHNQQPRHGHARAKTRRVRKTQLHKAPKRARKASQQGRVQAAMVDGVT